MSVAESTSHSSVWLPSQVFAEWRASARLGLQNGVKPEDFNPAFPELCKRDLESAVHFPLVHAWFLEMARTVALHRDETKWSLLYAILWRLNHGEASFLIESDHDPAMIKARFLQKAVLRDMHKMRAFLRFQEKNGFWIAWYAPAHDVLEVIAESLVSQHHDRVWVVHTPFLSVRWNLRELEFSAGLERAPRILSDESVDTFERYQAAQGLSAKIRRKPLPLRTKPRHPARAPARLKPVIRGFKRRSL